MVRLMGNHLIIPGGTRPIDATGKYVIIIIISIIILSIIIFILDIIIFIVVNIIIFNVVLILLLIKPADCHHHKVRLDTLSLISILKTGDKSDDSDDDDNNDNTRDKSDDSDDDDTNCLQSQVHPSWWHRHERCSSAAWLWSVMIRMIDDDYDGYGQLHTKF